MLTGRTALVTGASRGIGAAIAVRLAAEGAKVAVTARTASDPEPRFPGTIHETVRSIARNLDDLRRTVRALTAKGVQVEFVTEQLCFTGDDNAMGTLLLSVMGAFAEFERSLILERQREGIALAEARGAYRGRRKSLNDDQMAELRRLAAEGVPKAVLARQFRISRETVYQYLRRALP